MRLLLIRHGQTACNVTNRWQGWADCALNDVGMAQAQAVSRWLTGERIDALYSSDLRRALQTAWAIGEPHGLQPIADADLRGRKAGQFEGLFEDQVLALAPTWQRDRTADHWGWAPPGGETLRQVLERNLMVIDRLRQEHAGHTVAAVTHEGPVRVLISHLTGLSPAEAFQIELGSTGVTTVLFDGPSARVAGINDRDRAG